MRGLPLRRGDIVGFGDFARFHLGSAFEIADVLLQGQGPSAEQVELLMAQLEAGLPAEALGLMDLPVPLGRGEYLALHRAGITGPEEVWALSRESLRGLVGSPMAARIDSARPQ